MHAHKLVITEQESAKELFFMENYTVMSTEQRFSDRAEKDVEVTLTLPDYLPNCVKIIRCDAKPVITEKNLRDGNLTVCGKLNMRLLYISDYNDKPKCFSDSRDFSHDFIPKTDLSGENTVIGAEVSLISCPCKMLSARQLQCTPRISVNVFANCAETHKLYDPSDGKNDGVCAKTEQTAICEKSYIEPVSDTLQTQINLENGEPNISEILCTDAEPVITSATCREGAADYSGYADIHCIYEAEQSDEEQTEPVYFAVKRRVEFSGSVDMPGITPDSKAVLVPEVFMTDSGISYDPYGENRIITVNVQYIVSGSLYNCGITEICTDAFGTKYKCDAKYGVQTIEKLTEFINTSAKVNEKIHADLRQFREITDSTATCKVTGIENSESKVFANIKANVTLFGTAENGSLSSADYSFGCKVPIDNAKPYPDSRFEVDAHMDSADFTAENGVLTCNASISLVGAQTQREKVGAVESCEVDKDTNISGGKAQIIVYYPDKDETLWEIAKTYAVDPEQLQNDNSENSRILIIAKHKN